MAIRRIALSNFKSFDSVDIELSDLSVLIGANASGKSNFIQIFKFLRDMIEFGLDNAISMQGGYEYLLNSKLGASREFSAKIYSNTPENYHPHIYSPGKEAYGCEALETTYSFVLSFRKRPKRFEILEDVLRQRCNFYTYVKGEKRGIKKSQHLGEGEIKIERLRGVPRFSLKLPSGLQEHEKDLHNDVFEFGLAARFLGRMKLRSEQLYLEAPFYAPLAIGSKLRDTFTRISIYDFDPRLSKKAQLVTGRAELEPDGSNLAVVISNLLKNRERKQKFYNLLCDVLPFIERFRIQNIANTVLFTLREKYSRGTSFPTFLISDGTINLTSLIICLFFEDKSLKVIEEPERNIHPYLISRVMDLMREASKGTQIVTTTHNPEIVRHADINDLLLVFRTKDGFSQIDRPVGRERVKAFLQEEMGIDELYVQNLL